MIDDHKEFYSNSELIFYKLENFEQVSVDSCIYKKCLKYNVGQNEHTLLWKIFK